jgi:hypothetical protein
MADAAIWAKRVAEWRASGSTAREFCEGRDYKPSTLQWWSYRLRKLARRHEPPKRAVSLARVVVRRGVPPAVTAPTVVIDVDGTRVFVAHGVDHETLGVVLDVLASRRASR